MTAYPRTTGHFHALVQLGAGRMFERCQLCGGPPPDRICADCDLEACIACTEPKGATRG